MDKKPTAPALKGLVIGLLMVLASFIVFKADLSHLDGAQYFVYAILLAGVVVSVYIYGKQMNFSPTFGNYFAHGFKVAAVVALIMIGYLVIFLYAFPEYKEKALIMVKEELQKDKNSTPVDVDQGVEMMRKGFILFAVGGSLLQNLFLGLLGSLLGAAITKKEKTNTLQQVNQIGS